MREAGVNERRVGMRGAGVDGKGSGRAAGWRRGRIGTLTFVRRGVGKGRGKGSGGCRRCWVGHGRGRRMRSQGAGGDAVLIWVDEVEWGAMRKEADGKARCWCGRMRSPGSMAIGACRLRCTSMPAIRRPVASARLARSLRRDRLARRECARCRGQRAYQARTPGTCVRYLLACAFCALGSCDRRRFTWGRRDAARCCRR